MPFGRSNKGVVGVVLATGEPPSGVRVKRILEQLDQQPIFDPTLMKLGGWLAEYYFHPVGQVFRTMLPSSQTETKKDKVYLQEEGVKARDSEEHELHNIIRRVFTHRSFLLKKTFEGKISQLEEEWGEENLERKLFKAGLIDFQVDRKIKVREVSSSSGEAAAPQVANKVELNKDQKAVLDQLLGRFQSKDLKPNLLWGLPVPVRQRFI